MEKRIIKIKTPLGIKKICDDAEKDGWKLGETYNGYLVVWK